MTIPNNTTYKLIGLAATGAAMLGMNLEDALCTDPAELARTIDAYLTRHTTTTPAVAAAAEEDPAVLTALGLPATPATQPELALGYELPPPPPPAGAHGILARAAKLNQTQA